MIEFSDRFLIIKAFYEGCGFTINPGLRRRIIQRKGLNKLISSVVNGEGNQEGALMGFHAKKHRNRLKGYFSCWSTEVRLKG